MSSVAYSACCLFTLITSLGFLSSTSTVTHSEDISVARPPSLLEVITFFYLIFVAQPLNALGIFYPCLS